MGFFDGLVNSVGGLVGIKPFKGGPYPDAGKGDVLAQQAQDYATQQQQAVAQYMAQIAPIIASIAQNAGIANPTLSTGPASQRTPGTAPQTTDPYGLSPLQQAQVNQQAGVDTQAKNAIMQKIKANLSARGLGDSSVLSAAEAYLDQQLAGQLGSERVQAGQNAFNTRENAQMQIAQLLAGALQAQTGANTQGFGALSGATQNQQQTALNAHQESMTNLGNILGFFAPQLGNIGRTGSAPFNPNDQFGTGVGNVQPLPFFGNSNFMQPVSGV